MAYLHAIRKRPSLLFACDKSHVTQCDVRADGSFQVIGFPDGVGGLERQHPSTTARRVFPTIRADSNH